MKKNCLWLTCALILSLSAAVPAWPSFITVQTDVALGNPSATTTDTSFLEPGCPPNCSATSLLVNSGGSGNASASASFGAFDATSTVTTLGPSSSFAGQNATGSVDFGDSFSVLSGSGTGTFEIAFVTSGTAVSAIGNGADASIFLQMHVGDGTLAGTVNEIYDVSDSISESGVETKNTTGLPTTVFTVDASDGQTVFFAAQLSAESNSFAGGSMGSAADPVSVIITAPAGFTFSTASGATYSPTPSPSPVPEPSSLLLLSSGLACLGAWRRKMLKRI